jgi:hypothetical protein
MGVRFLIVALLLVSVVVNLLLVIIVFSNDAEVAQIPLEICVLDGDCEEGFECKEGELCDGEDNCYVERYCQSEVVSSEECWTTTNIDYVCGVDGVSYVNPTVADCEGVEVMYKGKCFDEECSCPRNFDPVCGTGGVTYSNRCFAECDGVEVVHDGECRKVSSGYSCENGICSYSDDDFDVDNPDVDGSSIDVPDDNLDIVCGFCVVGCKFYDVTTFIDCGEIPEGMECGVVGGECVEVG